MEDNTLLHRQVHPTWVVNNKVSSQTFEAESKMEIASLTFIPSPKDEGKLSVYNGEKHSAKEAFMHYTEQGFQSCGVVSVLVSECKEINLPCTEDNHPFDGHSYIDYTNEPSKGSIKNKAQKLKKKATDRNWTYKEE